MGIRMALGVKASAIRGRSCGQGLHDRWRCDVAGGRMSKRFEAFERFERFERFEGFERIS
jgi:hypothetical protein